MNVSERKGFDSIIGQELGKRVLMKAVSTGVPTHAYLFLGPQGIGKTTVALELAKALNCENPQGGNACGECAVCHAIEHGNSPDVTVWSPQGQNTKIEQMREMRSQANFKPMRARWKINIVEQADTLNEESANCILKLLEEPPPYLINILIFRNAASILPTIRSRCQMVRFTPVDRVELAQRLAEDYQVPQDEADFLATYSQGRPGMAIGLIGNSDFFDRRNTIIHVAGMAGGKNSWAALKLAETLRKVQGGSTAETTDDSEESGDGETPEVSSKVAKNAKGAAKKNSRDALIESLDILALWYRDLMLEIMRGDHDLAINSDKTDELALQARRYAHAGRIFSAIEAILQAKRALLGNANPQIVTEALMMRL